jgi:hypothetical protein
MFDLIWGLRVDDTLKLGQITERRGLENTSATVTVLLESKVDCEKNFVVL